MDMSQVCTAVLNRSKSAARQLRVQSVPDLPGLNFQEFTTLLPLRRLRSGAVPRGSARGKRKAGPRFSVPAARLTTPVPFQTCVHYAGIRTCATAARALDSASIDRGRSLRTRSGTTRSALVVTARASPVHVAPYVATSASRASMASSLPVDSSPTPSQRRGNEPTPKTKNGGRPKSPAAEL